MDENLMTNAETLDVLFKEIDDLMWLDQWEQINKFLVGIDVAKESLTYLIGVLTITLPGRVENRLPARPVLFNKIKARIHLERPLDEEGLLSGLE